MKYEYDITVIGAGSGGLVVASGAAGIGAKVLLIENRKMGGDCLNYGCVPSKTFLKSTHIAKELNEAHKFGLKEAHYTVDLAAVMERVKSVINEIAPHDSVERFQSLGVDVILGAGYILSPNKVRVGETVYTTKKIVIATGSTALIPSIKGLSEVKYETNETIFELNKLPKEMVIMGGGPIGMELGQGFANLGTKVHIIDRGDSLFKKDEPEVWPVMKEVFTNDGLILHLESEILEVKQNGSLVNVSILHKGKMKEISCEVLMIALGRKANSQNIGLENIGVKLDNRGFIQTNDKLQTSINNIYACGDVHGKYLFTHSAGYEASVIIKNALVAPFSKATYYNVAWSTYTSPEVAHVGYSQQESEKKGILGSVVFQEISNNDRSKAENDCHGFIKIILNKKQQVIGATIVSQKGGELLASLGLMVTHKMKLSKALSVMYPYPTQSEFLKNMALMNLKNNVKTWQIDLLKKIVRR